MYSFVVRLRLPTTEAPVCRIELFPGASPNGVAYREWKCRDHLRTPKHVGNNQEGAVRDDRYSSESCKHRTISAVKPIVICPKCGKVMAEESEFEGLWTCPDYKVTTDNKPPFRYKCTGMILTEKGSQNLEDELYRQSAERN